MKIAIACDHAGYKLKETIKELTKTFIETPFSNIDRYKIRNNKIKDIENDV